MDLYKEQDRGRLFRSLEHSYRSLEPFRTMVHDLVQEVAGPNYGQSAEHAKREKPLNLLRQAMVAYTMSLAANRPQVLVSTHYTQLSAFARHFEQATNNLLKEIHLEETIQRWVVDAFFCFGIVKAHMGDSQVVQIAPDLWMDPGRPFASNVSLDNFCFDMSATRWSQVQFAADSYRIRFKDLQNPDLYDQEVVSQLTPGNDNDDSDDRVDRLSRSEEVARDDLEPMISLMDVWIPAEGKIYTFAMSSRTEFKGMGAPVSVMDWDGPENGPYHMLSFLEIPDNIMPSSVADQLLTLDRLINNLMRKQSLRARRARTVHTYTPAGKKAAETLRKTGGDEWIEVEDASNIGIMNIGGIDQPTQAFLLSTMDMFDRMGGNLQAKMGLGSGAPTLGQEKLLHGAASNEEAHMQNRVMTAVTALVHDLGWMLWNDQFKKVPGRIQIPGADQYSMDATWTPEDREGDFFDYNFEIDVFSMSYQAPQQRFNTIMQLVSQVYGPMGPMIQQQGGVMDIQKLNDILAHLLNEPRLRELIRFSSPATSDQPPPAGVSSQGMPSQTTREYVRRSVPTGGTQQNRSLVMQQALLGGGSMNNDQMQSLQMATA